jgi:Nucleotidyl transferase AbiEii toxin, Type IV TA system
MRVLPLLGDQTALALKGGTAINLFVQHLPRLSVDIDLAYTGLDERDAALARIHATLRLVQAALERLGLHVQPAVLGGTPHIVKLLVRDRVRAGQG